MQPDKELIVVAYEYTPSRKSKWFSLHGIWKYSKTNIPLQKIDTYFNVRLHLKKNKQLIRDLTRIYIRGSCNHNKSQLSHQWLKHGQHFLFQPSNQPNLEQYFQLSLVLYEHYNPVKVLENKITKNVYVDRDEVMNLLIDYYGPNVRIVTKKGMVKELFIVVELDLFTLETKNFLTDLRFFKNIQEKIIFYEHQ